MNYALQQEKSTSKRANAKKVTWPQKKTHRVNIFKRTSGAAVVTSGVAVGGSERQWAAGHGHYRHGARAHGPSDRHGPPAVGTPSVTVVPSSSCAVTSPAAATVAVVVVVMAAVTPSVTAATAVMATVVAAVTAVVAVAVAVAFPVASVTCVARAP